MINYGDFDTIGKAWVCLAEEVLSKGIERHRDGEVYTELKGITYSVSGKCSNDSIINEYGDKSKIQWMLNNFEVLHPVKELNNANSYASRLYNYCGIKNQISWVVDKINSHRFTRSATITTLEPLTDIHYIPCISMLDFDIEEDSINLYVYSRGLDFGNKAYGNMICLTDILKMVATKTGMVIGKVNFICKSIHIYDMEYSEMRHIIKSVKAAKT